MTLVLSLAFDYAGCVATLALNRRPLNRKMDIPYLHLLDRNAVSLIKEANAGKEQLSQKKIAFLDRLRKLDRLGDYISALLSIIEGELGREDTVGEKALCQAKESTALRHFFQIRNNRLRLSR